MRIAIRREEKSRWERRVPLTPADVASLIDGGFAFTVQPSPLRAFPDAAYADAGAAVRDALDDADLIMGVKELPADDIRPLSAYLFFSHTIKGQAHNMPMLRALCDRGCTLLDYERITDAEGLRLVAFGRHAGLAGTIDALHFLGARARADGVPNPLEPIRCAHEYADLEAARAAVREAGERIRKDGLPEALTPLVVGLVGYGNVARGAQEILDLLPTRVVEPEQLLVDEVAPDPRVVQKVVFGEEHTAVHAAGAPFSLQQYRSFPELYRSRFEAFVPRIRLLINAVYWEPRFPRLVRRAWLAEAARTGRPLPAVIADISCDIEGAIECTVRATTQSEPVFVWDPVAERALPGLEGPGPVVMAVDNLPCELPIESSIDFSAALAPLLKPLSRADLAAPSADAARLPSELARAAIVWRGALVPRYAYLRNHLP